LPGELYPVLSETSGSLPNSLFPASSFGHSRLLPSSGTIPKAEGVEHVTSSEQSKLIINLTRGGLEPSSSFPEGTQCGARVLRRLSLEGGRHSGTDVMGKAMAGDFCLQGYARKQEPTLQLWVLTLEFIPKRDRSSRCGCLCLQHTSPNARPGPPCASSAQT
jgi:hypothetical protein